MANIDQLAVAAIRLKSKSDISVGWPLAVTKAIRATGITYSLDVVRIRKQVLRKLREHKHTSPKQKKEIGVVTADQASRDFNIWLARKHAQSGKSGTTFEMNFAKLGALIDQFRTEYYPSLSQDDLPEVSEIETEVRTRWGIKRHKSRLKRKDAEHLRAKRADEAARQLDLFIKT
jgi:hypothetical protein